MKAKNYNAIKKTKALNRVKHYSKKKAKIIFRLNEYDSDVSALKYNIKCKNCDIALVRNFLRLNNF